MASRPRAGLWWRWRTGPLRRRSDVVEGWVLLVSALLMAVGGVLAGTLAALAVQQTSQQEQERRQRVVAELLKDAGGPRTGDAAYTPAAGDRALTTARWTAPDGTDRQGVVRVAEGSRAGSTVPLWVDQQGRRTTEPPGPILAGFQSALAGTLAAGTFAAVVAGLQYAARAALDRRRMAQWERAWAEVEPRWRPRTP